MFIQGVKKPQQTPPLPLPYEGRGAPDGGKDAALMDNSFSRYAW